MSVHEFIINSDLFKFVCVFLSCYLALLILHMAMCFLTRVMHFMPNRQMVARSLLDTLKAVSEDERDCIAVLERVSKLSDDSGELRVIA